MSFLNQAHFRPIEAENPLCTKQFNASSLQSSVKKKALADVKNTLHQIPGRSICKPNTTSIKPATFGGRNLFNGVEESKDGKMKTKREKKINGPIVNDILSLNTVAMASDDDCVHTCKCDEIPEDDTDILFKGMKLTTSEIENYALNWENTPVFTFKDKRDLYSIDELEPIALDFDYKDVLEILDETIPEIKIPQLEVSVPPLFLEEVIFVNRRLDGSIFGL